MITGLIVVIAICVITGFIAGAACNEMTRQRNHVVQLKQVAILAEQMMNRRDDLIKQYWRGEEYLADFKAIRASLKTIALELQRRGGWTH